jgi:hypothetical protein
MLRTERFSREARAARAQPSAAESLTVAARLVAFVNEDETVATLQPRDLLPTTPTVTSPLSLVGTPLNTCRKLTA